MSDLIRKTLTKCCSVFVYIIKSSRISLCSWFCVYFVDSVCSCCALLAHVRCTRPVNTHLHYIMDSELRSCVKVEVAVLGSRP